MARQEQPREDLLREATALVERIELQVQGFEEHVVVGFRRGGAASFFLGEDPVYQFNAVGQLRRAFVAGRMLKAEGGRLIELERQRLPDRVELVRRELAPQEQTELLHRAAQQLGQLREALCQQKFSRVGQVPADVDLARRVQAWLDEFGQRPVSVASAPGVGRSPKPKNR